MIRRVLHWWVRRYIHRNVNRRWWKNEMYYMWPEWVYRFPGANARAHLLGSPDVVPWWMI